MSDSLQPHGLQHTRPPYPSPSPGVYPSSCSLHRDAIQPSHPLKPSSPSILNLSKDQGLFNESWSFSFSISPSSEYSGFSFIKTDWFHLLCYVYYDRENSHFQELFALVCIVHWCVFYSLIKYFRLFHHHLLVSDFRNSLLCSNVIFLLYH